MRQAVGSHKGADGLDTKACTQGTTQCWGISDQTKTVLKSVLKTEHMSSCLCVRVKSWGTSSTLQTH